MLGEGLGEKGRLFPVNLDLLRHFYPGARGTPQGVPELNVAEDFRILICLFMPVLLKRPKVYD